MPDWTTTRGPITPPTKPHYPKDSDATVRQWASYLNYQSAIDTLDEIKDELFGNADQVDSLAYQWAQNQVMNNDQTNIQTATNNLAGNWQGPAYEQYTTFTSAVTSTLGQNQQAMGSIGNTLGNCVSIVYQTYASAINFIGSCAGALAPLAVEAPWLAVPGVDIVDAGVMYQQASNALGQFVTNVSTLIGGAVTQIGQYKQDGVMFASASNSYKAPAAPGQLMGDPAKWHEEK